jgi:hypothetical protein
MPEQTESPADSAAPIARSYLAWALAATVLCFLPLGLIALFFGMRVNTAVAEGRPDDAARASRAARRWLVATVVVGLLIYLLLGVTFALLGAFSP